MAPTADNTNPAATPRAPLWLPLIAASPVLVLVLLRAFDVPLGKLGTFHYRYAPPETIGFRLELVPMAAGCAALLATAIYLLAVQRRALGRALLCTGFIALWAWMFFAPPAYQSQHVFNFRSPSHTGAFLIEAEHARAVGIHTYLAEFPDRVELGPEALRGTRVSSNPPGATLIAAGGLWLLDHLSAARALADWLIGPQQLNDKARRISRAALFTATLFHTLGLLAVVPWFAAARRFLGEWQAWAVATLCVATPAVLLFSPGKDAAQLLTVGVALWLWLSATQRGSAAIGAGAGFAALIGLLLGLVHVWIALAILVATLTTTPRTQQSTLWLRVLPAATVAFALGCLTLTFAGLNIVATVLAVSEAQTTVTRGPDAMPFHWQLLGLPLFLLFLPAALPAAFALRRRPPRFGLVLIFATALLMLATLAFTNAETPRLWLPFAALLIFGTLLHPTPADPRARVETAAPAPVATQSSASAPYRRRAILLALLVWLQITAGAAQWALMDMREAEYRLLQRNDGPRMFE